MWGVGCGQEDSYSPLGYGRETDLETPPAAGISCDIDLSSARGGGTTWCCLRLEFAPPSERQIVKARHAGKRALAASSRSNLKSLGKRSRYLRSLVRNLLWPLSVGCGIRRVGVERH